ncbi:MAG: hypothetical protein ABIG70_12870 [Pseudomonadota bacterium]
MPTKKRTEEKQLRELQIQQTKVEQDALFRNHPDSKVDRLFGCNIPPQPDDDGCPDPLCKLGHGLISGDEFGNVFPNSDVIGAREDRANLFRMEAAQRKAEQLKNKYPEQWNRRGGAIEIADAETAAGRPIHVDRVRRFIKRDKNRQASTSP